MQQMPAAATRPAITKMGMAAERLANFSTSTPIPARMPAGIPTRKNPGRMATVPTIIKAMLAPIASSSFMPRYAAQAPGSEAMTRHSADQESPRVRLSRAMMGMMKSFISVETMAKANEAKIAPSAMAATVFNSTYIEPSPLSAPLL